MYFHLYIRCPSDHSSEGLHNQQQRKPEVFMKNFYFFFTNCVYFILSLGINNIHLRVKNQNLSTNLTRFSTKYRIEKISIIVGYIFKILVEIPLLSNQGKLHQQKKRDMWTWLKIISCLYAIILDSSYVKVIIRFWA